MGLKELKQKIGETKSKIDVLQMAIKIMNELESVLPELLDEQKKTNELLEKILDKLEGEKNEGGEE